MKLRIPIKGFILLIVASCFFSCKKNNPYKNIDFAQEMRTFVGEISAYARAKHSGFIIIPQNGEPIVTKDKKATGAVDTDYLNAIDGIGREDLLYGYDGDNVATSGDNTNEMLPFLNILKNNGKTVLVTDYCRDADKTNNSFLSNSNYGFISFAATERDLNVIPSYSVYNENANDINKLSDAKNFLYIINSSNYPTKESFINAVKFTNYDIIIMDIYCEENIFNSTDIALLKNKENGGKRLVIAYMSIGEAENYRWYWSSSWTTPTGRVVRTAPEWLDAQNPLWQGNYKVKYWFREWKNVIYGYTDSYLNKIIDAGFDGVYLDIIDAYEYYETKYIK
ncbi:MAG: endo alpha-1,4 polygalactosaminidase [Bacteroidales bacterium]|nr:endo alpha-1,4 polygalactosaminidase [Bacteroidales bacterium]